MDVKEFPEAKVIAHWLEVATGSPTGDGPIRDESAWITALYYVKEGALAIKKRADIDAPDWIPAYFHSAWDAARVLGAVDRDIHPRWLLVCVLDCPTRDLVIYTSFWDQTWASPVGLARVYDMYWIPRYLASVIPGMGKLAGREVLTPASLPLPVHEEPHCESAPQTL